MTQRPIYIRLIAEAAIGAFIIAATLWLAFVWLPSKSAKPGPRASATVQDQFKPSAHWGSGP